MQKSNLENPVASSWTSNMRPPAVRSRACISLALAVFAATATTACTGGVALVRRLTCETKLLQQERSPNGARVASLYLLNCGGAMNSYEAVVYLTDRSDTLDPLAFEKAQVSLYPAPGEASLVWRDDRHLTVRCWSCLPRQFKRRDGVWKDVLLFYEGADERSELRVR
jgi:hypothetical protein